MRPLQAIPIISWYSGDHSFTQRLPVKSVDMAFARFSRNWTIFRIPFAVCILLAVGSLDSSPAWPARAVVQPPSTPVPPTHARPHHAHSPNRDAGGKPSAVIVHVTVPPTVLTGVYAAMEDQLRQDTRDGWIALDHAAGFLRAPWWRERLSLNMYGPRLDAEEELRFSLIHAGSEAKNGSPLSQCGRRPPDDPPGTARLHHSTTFGVTSDYHIRATGTTVRLDSTASCRLTTFTTDPSVQVAAQLKKEREAGTGVLATLLDHELPIREPLAQAWATLQDPILIDETSRTWLLLNPRRTQAGTVIAQQQTLNAAVGVIVEPQLIRSPTPPSRPPIPLPVAAEPLGDPGFHLTLDVPMPYREAELRLQEALVGQRFSGVAVQGARFTPAGTEAVVELDLDLAGLAPLTLQFTGTPAFDEAAQTVSFAHFDYQVKNRSTVTDFAESFLHDEIRHHLQRKLTIALANPLAEARQAINQTLNRAWKGGRLQGDVTALRVLGLSMKPEFFLARFASEGALHYFVPAKPGGPKHQTP